nr:immunoglobulin heavy chain junction region [Macaca mulatta]
CATTVGRSLFDFW